jgi:hypothetical protein
LPDPIHGLKLAADRTNEVLFLNTNTKAGEPDGSLVMNTENVEHKLAGIHGLCWLPTGPKVLEGILRWLGFVETRCQIWNKDAGGGVGRVVVVGSKVPGLLS